MKCTRCGSEVDEKWKFCPRCGFILKRERDFFSEVFERMERELKGMDKAFERNLEVFDLSPFFRKPTKGSGFSIKITRSGHEKPEVSVRTFGDVDRKEVEEEMEKLGFREIPEEKKTVIDRPEMKEEGREICLEAAKITEEPETCVRRVDDRIVVEVKLPEVRDSKDIEVKFLDNSIEVKAIAGEKAYFKILTKPPKTNVVRKGFENGILKIELV